MIKKIEALGTDHKEEAAQLLLITAATESQYAKFRLARTLYKGEILQRTFQKEREKRIIQDTNTIDEFNLFTEPENDREIRTLDLDDMMKFSNDVAEEKLEKIEKNIDFDSLLNIDTDDILPNNIKIDTRYASSNTFWDAPEKLNMQNDDIPKDTFFDTEEIIPETFTQEEVPQKTIEEIIEKPLEVLYNKEELRGEESHKEPLEEEKDIETFEEEAKKALEELKPRKQKNEVKTENAQYKAIPYIDQKFKNMHVQYPPVQETLEIFPSVEAWLLKISHEGYSEKDVEAMIKKIEALGTDHKEEAAQLLLITAATESQYAKFRLARTLYKGEILQQNLAESFTLINRLATNDDYPEAICDLAQFYEYGIGIDKDKKKAELLYEEAMNSGIKRAADHYERIRKQNKGLFSFLKK